MSVSSHLQSDHADNGYKSVKQEVSSGYSGRVPSNWLSFPIVQHTSVHTPPPCGSEVREMLYGPISGNPQALAIRLIEIENTNDEHGRMSCLLRSSPLSQAPEFRALSYCWNDSPESAPRKTVLVNGYEFKVQPSLHDALQMLRKHGYNTLWIDAICLNQQDDEEKAQQVPQMRLIYQQAVEVVVWLGNEAHGSTKFLNLLQTIARSSDWQFVHSSWRSRLPAQQDEYRGVVPDLRENFVKICARYLILQSEPELAKVDLSDDKWQSRWPQAFDELKALFKAFFERPYWRRTWIVQEIASGRRLRVLCGDSEVGWEVLASLSILDDGTRRWSDHADIGSSNMGMIEKLRYKISNRIPIGFLTALQRSYGCEAGDIRDKVYALLGLCWNAKEVMPYVSYAADNTLNQIMFALMQQWTNSGNLDIICLQPHNEDNDYGLPSWLPKWLTVGRSPMNERLVDHIENRRAEALLSTHGHSWMATKRSSGPSKFDDDNRIMIVKGKEIDVIDGLSAACDHFWRDPRLQECWHSRSPAPATAQHMQQIRQDLYWTLNMYKERDGNSLTTRR